jgi:hypothetical protein
MACSGGTDNFSQSIPAGFLGDKLAGLTVLAFITILIVQTVKNGQLKNIIHEHSALD